MSLDDMVQRIESNVKGPLAPLLVLRVAESKHRKGGGGQPECIKMSPDFYDAFMNSYKFLKSQIDESLRDQIDMERPHLLGIPIICEPSLTDDIMFYVPHHRESGGIGNSPIIIP